MVVLVYKLYVKATRMTKIENSGIQIGIHGNLVYERYTDQKKRYKIVYRPFLFAVGVPPKQDHTLVSLLLKFEKIYLYAIIG